MRRGDFTGRTAAHTAARTCVDGSTGARTTRSALRRSARQFARGSALARRRRFRLWESQAGDAKRRAG